MAKSVVIHEFISDYRYELYVLLLLYHIMFQNLFFFLPLAPKEGYCASKAKDELLIEFWKIIYNYIKLALGL